MNKELRKELIKRAFEKKLGHVGSALSCLDAVDYLFSEVMKEGDIFILSKGHGAMALYTVLEKHGENPNWVMHPEIDESKGIYATTGSLGHGFPIAIGRAFGKRLKEAGRVFVLLGDGELSEGSVWEAFILANRFKLDNLFIFIDWNKYGGLDDSVKKLFDFDKESIENKIRAFGFNAITIDGHDEKELRTIKEIDSDTVVILDTIKGKGVKLLEETHFHGYNFSSNPEEYEKALKDLE